MSSSSCNVFTVSETDFVCENGIITTYIRNLDIVVGEWVLDRTAGSCDCTSSSSSASETSSSSESSGP